MDLKPGTLRHLQEYIHEQSIKRGFADETAEEQLIILVEEIGEIAKAYRKNTGMYVSSSDQGKDNEDIGQEVADVINMLFAFATSMGIDIERSFLEKEVKNTQRTYERAENKG